LKRETYGHNIL